MSDKPVYHGRDHRFALNASGNLVSAGADPISGIEHVRDSYLSSAVATLDGGGSPYSSDGAYPTAQTLTYVFVKTTSGSEGASIASTSSTALTLQPGIYQTWLTLNLDTLPAAEFDAMITVPTAGSHVRGYSIGAINNSNAPFMGYGSGTLVNEVGSSGTPFWQASSMAWIQVPAGETAVVTVKTISANGGIGLNGGSNLSIIRLGGVNPVSNPTGLS